MFTLHSLFNYIEKTLLNNNFIDRHCLDELKFDEDNNIVNREKPLLLIGVTKIRMYLFDHFYNINRKVISFSAITTQTHNSSYSDF